MLPLILNCENFQSKLTQLDRRHQVRHAVSLDPFRVFLDSIKSANPDVKSQDVSNFRPVLKVSGLSIAALIWRFRCPGRTCDYFRNSAQTAASDLRVAKPKRRTASCIRESNFDARD
jgi:hypothetical protein